MGKSLHLEELKKALSDDKVWISLAVVDKTEWAQDRSVIRAECTTLPDEATKVIASVGMSATGADSGDVQEPMAGDVVLIAYADADPEYSFIISRISSTIDTIPVRSLDGHRVIQAISGKNLSLGSDSKVTIGRGGLVEESEPLALGAVLSDCIDTIFTRLDTFLGDVQAGPVGVDSIGGSVVTHPALIAKITALKAQVLIDVATFLTNNATNIVSQIAFTER